MELKELATKATALNENQQAIKSELQEYTKVSLNTSRRPMGSGDLAGMIVLYNGAEH